MSVKTYSKNANPIEYMKFESNNPDDYKEFLKDDYKGQVSFEDGKICVETDWGDYSGDKGYIIIKYGPGDYNIVEPSIFDKTYEKLSDGTAVKTAKVEAMEYTGKNHLEVILFAGNNVEFGDHGGLAIRTLEGLANIKEGDYIIKGVKGEFYPNDKETFEKNYHEVKSDSDGKIEKNDTLRGSEILNNEKFNILKNEDAYKAVEKELTPKYDEIDEKTDQKEVEELNKDFDDDTESSWDDYWDDCE